MKNIYLFILAPPHSGSTLLSKIISTSPAVSVLAMEGQFISSVKSIYANYKIWDPSTSLPWRRIKTALRKEWNTEKPILLEKSPPHLVHAKEIACEFSPARFILLMRDPYTFCESARRRNGRPVNEAAENWVKIAKCQYYNQENLGDVLFSLKYEDLVAKPRALCEQMVSFLPQLGRLDTNRNFEVHSIRGHQPQPIHNFNEEQIQHLSNADLTNINKVFGRHLDLLNTFGYELRKPSFRRIFYYLSAYVKDIVRHRKR